MRPAERAAAGALLLARCLAALVLLAGPVRAGPYLVFDAATHEVLAERQAFDPWYPASLTKLMTTYVVLKAMADGELLPNSPVVISARSLQEPPSRMGFPVGTVLTLDTALKIIMVKSANDVAYAIAESVAGSGAAFVERMNAASAALGLSGTRWANPHGLPDPGNRSSARDLALLSAAIIDDFPEAYDLFRITALQLDGEIISTHNRLLQQFPGADGLKTGYICSSGFNVVASATRGGRRIVAVVLGEETELFRSETAARLLTEGFAARGGFFSSRPTLEELRPSTAPAAAPVDLRPQICERSREELAALIAAENDPTRVSYLTEPFAAMPPVPISLNGAIALETPAVVSIAVSDAPLPRPRPLIFAMQGSDPAVSYETAGEALPVALAGVPLPRPNPLR